LIHHNFFQQAEDNTLTTFISNMPKVALHVHLEGTISPNVLKVMAEKHSLELPATLLTEGAEHHRWGTLLEFLSSHDEASQVVSCTDGITEITYEYLKASHLGGSIYSIGVRPWPIPTNRKKIVLKSMGL
jgi:adenosine deaminase